MVYITLDFLNWSGTDKNTIAIFEKYFGYQWNISDNIELPHEVIYEFDWYHFANNFLNGTGYESFKESVIAFATHGKGSPAKRFAENSARTFVNLFNSSKSRNMFIK